jgi:iron complex outermembrane receptor protein
VSVCRRGWTCQKSANVASAPRSPRSLFTVGVAVLISLSPKLPAQVHSPTPQALADASIEDLMNVEVTSVSRKEQALTKTGAAVFVIDQEAIRHSGATNIPDLLRMVPGVDVAQIDANTWAISIRGSNYRYANKVLVLIDGRTVYTPGFSGVYWDQQDVPLEDIDRIEVIRGPGGTVWGANAVNGVINITTKSSRTTKGGLIRAGVGSEQREQGLVQYGGAVGASGQYRVFGSYSGVAGTGVIPDAHPADGWHSIHTGFRSDWDLSHVDTLTVQGDWLGTSEGQTITTLFTNNLPNLVTFPDQVKVASGNVLGRWNHTFSNGSETSLQVYYDRFSRFDQALNVVSTGDADFQYHFHAGSRNDIVAGMGFRLTDESYTNGYEAAFGSGYRRDYLTSTFLQDQIALTDSVSLTVGSKLEHNSYTGLEYEPSAQLVWNLNDRNALWTSVARAIRQPSWYDTAINLSVATFPTEGGGFGVVQLLGQPVVKPERSLNYEVGYRSLLTKRLSLDITAFASSYANVQSVEPGTPYFTFSPSPPHLVVPSIFDSLAHGQTYGAEFFANWDLTRRLRISPGYSFARMKAAFDPSILAANAALSLGNSPGDSPQHQAQLRSTLNLPRNLEWDASAGFVSRLSIGPVPSYTRVDTRFAWRPGENVEFSITGQNLLTPRHFEFLDGLQVNPTPVARSAFAKVTWSF